MHRILMLTATCVLLVAGCGGESLTLSEYSSEVGALVETLDGRLDAKAEDYFAGPATVERAREYLSVRVDGYRDAVTGIDALDPPDQVADLHATLQEVLGELLATEEARAVFADTVDSDRLDEIWQGSEARAITAAEERAIVLCYAAQTRFDDTEERAAFADVPWMPPDLKEVVSVALDCP